MDSRIVNSNVQQSGQTNVQISEVTLYVCKPTLLVLVCWHTWCVMQTL